MASVLLLAKRIFLLDRIARAQADDIGELRAVELGGPDFEFVNVWIGHHPLVERITVQFGREFLAAVLAAEVAQGCQENLKRYEALLAVNDVALFDMRHGGLLLV